MGKEDDEDEDDTPTAVHASHALDMAAMHERAMTEMKSRTAAVAGAVSSKTTLSPTMNPMSPPPTSPSSPSMSSSNSEAGSSSGSRASSRRSSESHKLEAFEVEEQTYNFTVEALLNAGGSIQTASKQSGKSLKTLMNVEERWMQISSELSSIEELETIAEDEYYAKLEALDEEEALEEERREKKLAMQKEKEKNGEKLKPSKGKEEDSHTRLNRARKHHKQLLHRKLTVLQNRRPQVFQNKENQVVIEQQYDSQVRKMRFAKLFRFALFLSALVFLGILETTRNNHTAYYSHKSLTENLSENGESGCAFQDIKEHPDFYSFLKGPLTDILYPEGVDAYWFPHPETPHLEKLPRGLINHYNVIIGRPRLRQIRSELVECDVDSALYGEGKAINANVLCFADDSDVAEESFGPNNRYIYQDEFELNTPSFQGHLGVYPGSGFVVILPSPNSDTAREEAAALWDQLEKDSWLDVTTRAVFIEITMYNPHENHFVVARMLLEFSLSGDTVTTANIDVVPLRRYSYASSTDFWLILLEVTVTFFWTIHAFSEYQQFRSAPSLFAHFSSVYNILDGAIVVLGPAVFALQVLSILTSASIDWADHDNYINVSLLFWCTQLQTKLYSIMTFSACLKLLDYLNVFHGLNRLLVMIEMMAGQLKSFMIVLGLFLFTFTVSEYVAYGYKDENSYSIFRGFLARVYGLFAGDPVTFGHTDSGMILGTIYVMAFLLLVPLLLLNLLVAMLTSAYDEARNQSSDVLAQRQYEKMDAIGLTKRRTLTIKSEDGLVLQTITTTMADENYTFIDKFDRWLVQIVRQYWQLFENWMDERATQIYQLKKLERAKNPPPHARENVIIIPNSQLQLKKSKSGGNSNTTGRGSLILQQAIKNMK